MHQADVSHAPLGQALVIKEHLVYLSLRDSVSVIIEGIHPGLRVVVMAGEYHADVGILGHHFVIDPLRLLAHASAGQQVLVEVQNSFSLRILCQHLVHPLNLLISDAPSHVHHDKVYAAHGDQVVMAPVVLVASPVPRIAAVSPFSEVLAEIAVISA